MDRESQLYDEFEHFRQIKEETIQGYYVRTISEKIMQRKWSSWNVGAQNRGVIINPGQAKPSSVQLRTGCQRRFDRDDSPENDLALNVGHVFEAVNVLHGL
ncbi:hypothetical protein Tco_0731808 [Tanacetum coccineum]